VDNKKLRAEVLQHVIQHVIPAHMLDADTKYHINPTGRFVVGGPMGDTGLTDARLLWIPTVAWVVTAADVSVAKIRLKWIVRRLTWRVMLPKTLCAGWRSVAKFKLAYAIGVAEPVSVLVEAFGTAKSIRDSSQSWYARISS